MGVRDADPRNVEENLATNLRQIREDQGLSQEELAQRMVERGFGFSQATIWKIEQGKRAVKISEAVALADAVGFEFWTGLLNSPGNATHYLRLQSAHFKAATTYNTLKAAAAEFLHAQLELSLTGRLARDSGDVGQQMIDHWTTWLQIPAERAVLEARVESDHEEEHSQQLDDAVNRLLQAFRDRGYQPLADMESWADVDVDAVVGTERAADNADAN